ncbi:unnamed protein product [Rotaria magnacalcarata]|uniref:Uncharacterized protein n=1 Tax=Rotaria magnacalcarata TaxID=392030 RepID=A0A816KYT5_9BILA|nr:unnamed protein product [Rotaria magnacalcarata]
MCLPDVRNRVCFAVFNVTPEDRNEHSRVFERYVSTTSNLITKKNVKLAGFQLQKSQIVDYSHHNQNDPDFDSDSDSDDSCVEEDEDTSGNCTDNEDSTEDDEDYLSDHLFKVSSTTFQGMRVFDSINPTLTKSYFIVNINGTKIYLHKQTAAWRLSNEKSTLSSDRLKRIRNK